MGAVYRATDTKLNREVAIKILRKSFAVGVRGAFVYWAPSGDGQAGSYSVSDNDCENGVPGQWTEMVRHCPGTPPIVH